MKNLKRNAIIGVAALLICAGIYLGFSGGKKTVDLTETLDAELLLDDTKVVMAQEEGDYFAAMRLSRQEARDSAVELLQETISYAGAEESIAASSQLTGIVSDTLSEAQIESLVIAKGYADCVAYLTEGVVSVAVAAPEEGLQQSDVALISDIVTSQTDCALSDVRIIEVK